MAIYTIEVLQAVPDLGLSSGDILIIEPGDSDECLVARRRPEILRVPRAVVDLLERGVGQLLTPQATIAEVAEGLGVEAAGCARPASPNSPPGPIDVDAALADLSDPLHVAPVERKLWELVGFDRHRFWQTVSRRRRKRERALVRICHCCGGEFTSSVSPAVTCPPCKAAKRRRCLDCEQVFTVPNGNVRRCEQCLATSKVEADAKAARRAKRRG